MFNFTQELNEQANKICSDLIKAKRAAKETKGKTAAYHEGRAEELEKWLYSVEALLEKVTENKRQKERAQNAL